MGMLSRRQVLKGMALGVAAGALRTVPVRAAAPALHAQFARIESQTGGRLGVAMLDTHNRIVAGYHANQRFPVCSTWKLLAVAALLRQVDEGHENLERRIRFSASELVVYAPVTKDHVDATGMSLRELCDAALVWSDNTAGNLLLAALGGPSAITRFARAIGDPVTRLDRTEPTLNEATPGDARDTTSPRAMLGDLDTLLLGNALTPPSRARLNAWLAASQTGARLLRAGFPAKLARGRQVRRGRARHAQRCRHRHAAAPRAHSRGGVSDRSHGADATARRRARRRGARNSPSPCGCGRRLKTGAVQLTALLQPRAARYGSRRAGTEKTARARSSPAAAARTRRPAVSSADPS